MRSVPWLVLLAAVFVLPAAHAAVPSTISYQGVLTDAGGGIVPDGTHSFTFKIYDVASGATPALWTETHASVPITSGRFAVLLGDAGTPIALPFNVQYWLGIA